MIASDILNNQSVDGSTSKQAINPTVVSDYLTNDGNILNKINKMPIVMRDNLANSVMV